MKRLVYLLWITLMHHVEGQVLTVDRRVDWTSAGYQGCIPNPSVFRDVTNYGAIGNGTTNNATAVANAISSLGGSAGIIYFPEGNYLINSTLNLPANVVLRGESSSKTTLTFNLGGATNELIKAAASAGSSFVSMSSGYTKGSTSIVVSNAANFNVGDYAEIRQANGSWDTKPASWAIYSVGQIVKIVGKSGNTLTLSSALRITYSASLNPEISKITPIQNVGIESLKIYRTDTPSAGGGYNIYFSYAANCWVKDVESDRSNGSHIALEACTNIEITGCYIHHAIVYDGSGTRGYGVTLFHHTGECLVENNVFRYLRHAMSIKQGANGNVLAYNYSREVNRSEFLSEYAGDISLHGHFAFANLFEGNVCQNLFIDDAWGPSGPYNTFFRNRIQKYGLVLTDGTIDSNDQNFIGNEITGTGIGEGSYTLVGTGHFAHGNNDNGTIKPTGTSALADQSYYLSGSPIFWSGSSWAGIGTPNSANANTIPAFTRYSGSTKTYRLPQITVTGGGNGYATLTSSSSNSYAWSNGQSTQNIIVNSTGLFTVTATLSDGCPHQNWSYISAQFLPVELLYFKAEALPNQQVKLKWATQSERNNHHFLIEKSPNLSDYTRVGFVETSPNSDNKKEYELVDNHPQIGTNYYRLTQVNLDGSSQTYRPIAVEVISDTPLIFPNPSTFPSFVLKACSEIREISLFSIIGTPISINTRSVSDHHKIVQLPPSVTSGIYLAHIKLADQSLVIKWILK